MHWSVVTLSACLPAFLHACLPVSICLSVCLSVCPSVCPSVGPPIPHLLAHSPILLHACLSVCQSLSLCVCLPFCLLSLCRSVSPTVCLSVSICQLPVPLSDCPSLPGVFNWSDLTVKLHHKLGLISVLIRFRNPQTRWPYFRGGCTHTCKTVIVTTLRDPENQQ